MSEGGLCELVGALGGLVVYFTIGNEGLSIAECGSVSWNCWVVYHVRVTEAPYESGVTGLL